MILNVFAFKNKKIDCFTQPFFSDVEPEKFVINTKRSLLGADDLKQIVPYKNLVLYIIGVFDDQKGIFITEDQDGNAILAPLYDCSKDVLDILASAKGVTDHGQIESVPADR